MAKSKAWGWVVCKQYGDTQDQRTMVGKTHKVEEDAYAECRALNLSAKQAGEPMNRLYSVMVLKG